MGFSINISKFNIRAESYVKDRIAVLLNSDIKQLLTP